MMFKTIHEIAADYNVPVIEVKKALCLLGIPGDEEIKQKSFAFTQYVIHGIARPVSDQKGSIHSCLYNLDTLREEFEALILPSSDIKERLLQLHTHVDTLLAANNTTGLQQVYAEITAICAALEKKLK